MYMCENNVKDGNDFTEICFSWYEKLFLFKKIQNSEFNFGMGSKLLIRQGTQPLPAVCRNSKLFSIPPYIYTEQIPLLSPI